MQTQDHEQRARRPNSDLMRIQKPLKVRRPGSRMGYRRCRTSWRWSIRVKALLCGLHDPIRLDRRALGPMMRLTVPGAEHYRELADKLREVNL